MSEKFRVLEKYFGHTKFRPGQESIIDNILTGQDVLGILPTGGGKSLCFQLPALMMDGLTLVISPLISLMQDQITGLRQQGISAAYLNSTQDEADYRDVLSKLYRNELKLLYVAPERLEHEGFQNAIKENNLAMVAVDEAHCVSQWGHDFRASYRNIHTFIEEFDVRPVVTAFSATATDRVQDDIINQLKLNNPKVFINSFDRPNLTFEVKTPRSKLQEIMNLVDREDAIIIYTQTRKNTEKVAQTLQDKGYKALPYHAGLSSQTRTDAQNAFLFDKVNIIVATNAFGMGIDKTDVRRVIHYNMPTDLEGYYQEAGRAGRDGLPSTVTLLFSNQDIMTANFLLQDSQDPTVQERLQAMIGYANHTGCLRQYILAYFDEKSPQTCGNCSSCLGQFETQEVTQESQMALSCIVRMRQSFGMTLVTDVLRGKNNEKIRTWAFDDLSTYGLLKNYSEQDVKAILSQLVASQYLKVNHHKALELTEKAKELLQGNSQVFVKKSKMTKKKGITTTRIPKSQTRPGEGTANPEIYEALRDLRYDLASDQGLPAYIVFSNRTLEDMVEKMPLTYEEFLDIDGVGEHKAQQYFEDFVEVIREFV